MNYLIGIAIGCCSMVFVYRLIPPKREREQRQDIKELKDAKKSLENENYYLKITLKGEIKENRDRIEAIELRQNQADLWFGSIIRHSRAQFDKDAVEEFLDEYGMPEEE